MKPGKTKPPAASTTSASFGAVRSCPTAVILPSLDEHRSGIECSFRYRDDPAALDQDRPVAGSGERCPAKGRVMIPANPTALVTDLTHEFTVGSGPVPVN